MKKRFKTMLFALLLVITTSPAFAGEIRLSAGAGMKPVLDVLSGNFAKAHPGATFIKNYAAAGALALQIENGAPADVYISADSKWVEYLKARKLLAPESITPFAWNEIVVIGAPVRKVSSMNDLTKLGRIALGNPNSAPAGEMAMDAIISAGLEHQLAGKLVMTRDMPQTLMYAETGAVDAAFVHLTEALTARKAKILFTVPHALYNRTPFTMALTPTGAANADARSFFSYLKSDRAKSILKRYGYLMK
jgi:molybdate transport system substrate-binding protein